MFVASSRTLLRRCRWRRCWLPLRLSYAELGLVNSNTGSSAGNDNFQNPSKFAFSTISFDSSAFTGDAASSGSVDAQSTSSKQLPAQFTEISIDAPAPRRKFQQRILQWMATNPKIAPYKAEEALAILWVEQQELFRQWEELQQQPASPPTVLLTTESVNLVLHAWCYSKIGEIAAERAERLLHWMEEFHPPESNLDESDSPPPLWSSFLPKPNYQSYATVIGAWSQSAVHESAHPSAMIPSDRDKKSGGRVKNVVSDATKAAFECAKRAEDVLMHMQRMHEQRLIDEGGISDHYTSEIQPDTRVFNLVLKAWSKIHGGTKASAIRAMRILDLMQELHHQQSKNAPEWQGMVVSKVQPSLQTYKLVIEAWARAAQTVEGPDRAEEILRHLLSLSKAGNLGPEITPDVECFHIVMRAHAESVRKRRKGDDGSASNERAQKASALLDWMELLALRVTTSKIQPTTESYRIALSAWAWSHHVDAPREAEGILRRMIRASAANPRDAENIVENLASTKKKSMPSLVRAETRDFNTVINCCSFARKVGADANEEDDESLLRKQIAHQEIFDIAEGVLDALISSDHAQPDSATFSGIIRACINLLPNTDRRDDRVIELFQLAYHTTPSEAPSPRISSTSSERMRAPPGAGCVDANVLRQLRHALPSTEHYIRVRQEFEDFRRRNLGEE